MNRKGCQLAAVQKFNVVHLRTACSIWSNIKILFYFWKENRKKRKKNKKKFDVSARAQDDLSLRTTSLLWTQGLQSVPQQPYTKWEKTENRINLLLLIKFPARMLINANCVLERLFTTRKSPCLIPKGN